MPRTTTLPLSKREITGGSQAWHYQGSYLLEAGVSSVKTETTYRSGLRLFADWLQHFGHDRYHSDDEWPLSPANLTTPTVLTFRGWLLANRSRSTATTYMAAVTGYLHFLDGMDLLPLGIQLGKLQRQLRRRSVDRNRAETVIDLDEARQDIPRIVSYFDQLPLPAENDQYNRRLSGLRNRALVKVLYSTAGRISEVISLNRTTVRSGQAAYAAIVGKGGKPRTLHIRPYAQQAIRDYLSERHDLNPALFVAHSRNANNARLSTTSVHNVVKRAVRALRLHGSISAHDFRHFRATQLLREGMPLEVIQELLGHADVSTTRGIYAPVLGVHVISEWLDNMDISPAEALRDDP